MPVNLHYSCAACVPKRHWWPGAINPGQDEENALLSFLQACSRPSQVSGIPDMSDGADCASLKHCSCGDTEPACPEPFVLLVESS